VPKIYSTSKQNLEIMKSHENFKTRNPVTKGQKKKINYKKVGGGHSGAVCMSSFGIFPQS
jgi:predicted RNA-binding protein with TRAM domain